MLVLGGKFGTWYESNIWCDFTGYWCTPDMTVVNRIPLNYFVTWYDTGKTHSVTNIFCTISTQHTSKQDAIITIRLYLANLFDEALAVEENISTTFYFLNL